MKRFINNIIGKVLDLVGVGLFLYLSLATIGFIFQFFIRDKKLLELLTLENTIIYIVSFLLLILIIKRQSAYISFGKYKGMKWDDLPVEYLDWLSMNTNHSKKAIKVFEKNKCESIITFGKYKGEKYKDLPLNYLFWLNHNTNGDSSFLAYLEIERREKLNIR